MNSLYTLGVRQTNSIQADLERRIGSGAEEPISVPRGMPTIAAAFENAPAIRTQEFYVRSSTGWKGTLDKLRSSAGSREEAQVRERREREAEETTQIIAGCRDDIRALWNDEVVHQMLDRRKKRLEDCPGLYVMRSILSLPRY